MEQKLRTITFEKQDAIFKLQKLQSETELLYSNLEEFTDSLPPISLTPEENEFAAIEALR